MSKHPTKSAVPPIDKSAELAEVVEEGVEVAMPTIENSPPFLFRPGASITTTDMLEIAMLFLLDISGGGEDIPQGGLRLRALSAQRVAQLSPEAQRWMKPMAPPATAG